LSLSSRCQLEFEIRGRDNESALHQTARFEFFEEPRRDGLPGAGIIGKEEANARQRKKLISYRFKSVRQWIDACDRKRKVGVTFIGKAQTVSSDT
jgi:hypothetical protein